MNLARQLFTAVADNDNPASVASRLRERRFLDFARTLLRQSEPVKILDVGGTPQFWSRHARALGKAEVTLLNQDLTGLPIVEGLEYTVGDARCMRQFHDREFDMCFSNSVIEHFPTYAEQQRFAAEIRRVARGYYVQTPSRYFPIEPHFLVPGWQFAPLPVRAWMLQRRAWGWMPRAKSRAEALETARSIRLLTANELRRLFPEAEIRRESVAGLTKSLIAVKPAAPSEPELTGEAIG
ncbi:MAG TPA: class I SAM-dependent methyltransferase [Bryobacteraceae bacterium]|nr:class I SAM-dependent methyltransferase [Bryobacteraceae bacterium]